MRIDSPEAPFIASTVLVIAAAVKRDGKIEGTAFRAVLATIAIVVVASLTAHTRAAPIVRALGIVYLLASAMLAINVFTEN